MDTKQLSVAEMPEKPKSRYRRRSLIVYDIILMILADIVILGVYPSSTTNLSIIDLMIHSVISGVCILGCRCFMKVYKQIWRYGGSAAYILLILADAMAGIVYLILQLILPGVGITFIHSFAVVMANLLMAISIRLMYQYFYERANRRGKTWIPFWKLLEFMTGVEFGDDHVGEESGSESAKIKIAIVGAGRVGAMLAEELQKNPRTSYQPCCFIDIDRSKIGRQIAGLPVYASDDETLKQLGKKGIQEIVFALPQSTAERTRELYEYYQQTGCRIKVYDYPVMQAADRKKRHLRDFDIEELLFRQPIELDNEKTIEYYRGKVILITGGGGSIGSELCRQIAKMHPKKLIILDVYENGAYDIQQELRIAYGDELKMYVEIVSVCDRVGFEQVFEKYRPDIVLHAAAHKHVPLMEHNCCEAVKNNVFGTLNAVELSEKYGVSRFILISTDKAVNPTNVMGATKRMCEMIVQSHSRMSTKTTFSATRFGNVLGSAGSVVPLFKKQIMNGGPVTITDKRIIRYFMTIPEASQLVLQSGAIAKNGELFVLDMGKPVKILELAENMIRLSGFEPYKDIQIIETGLRPGEKLYEELLLRSEELDATENSMIFIERDTPLELTAISEKLRILSEAVSTEDNNKVKKALMKVIPQFCAPDVVNTRSVAAAVKAAGE